MEALPARGVRELAGLQLRLPLATLAHCAVLAALVGFAYANALQLPFLFDDVPNIVLNPAVHPRSAADLAAVLDSPYSARRPLALATFALNYLAGGLDPAGYHLVNIVIHGANALLLYALIRILLAALGRDPGEAARLAFWGAALWAVNPLQTQAVTYVVQRMAALAALFYLAGLALLALHRAGRLRPGRFWMGLIACWVLALASKENAATLPLAVLLLDRTVYAHRRPLVGGRALALLALVLAGLAWFYLGGRLPDWTARYPGRDFSPLERLLTEPRVLWHYLGLYLWPLPSRLHLDYAWAPSRGLLDPPVTALALAAWALAAMLAWRLRRAAPLAAFALLFYLLASAVEASWVDLELVFEHRAYLPTAFLAAGALSLLGGRGARWSAPALAVAVGLAAHATTLRNEDWGVRAEFWRTEQARGATPARAAINRAFGLLRQGRHAEAVRVAEAALGEAEGRRRLILLNLIGMGRLFAGDLDGARSAFERQRAEFGLTLDAAFYLGEIALRAGDAAGAQRWIATLEAAGARPHARILEAGRALRAGDAAAAVARLREALAAVPAGDDELRGLVELHLANALLALGRPAQAREVYLRIVRRDPENHEAWRALMRMLEAGGDAAGAARIRRLLEGQGVAP
ncbi:tetratricopeptide repeat protein [Inmirania thermothiophila]|uniref:Tetratricopeptide repeat protein n=1 Tax=Inmirania thermothiophila TaxID=1750597 RepID=A0A3N1Y5W4_9GAMM|nr:tetratricopeptide repeat protein [Inmirania thermothiophila]ROR34199.1 tetratricopeptide repeat protein [Inmirania thermothiophila]